ncbi:unnamed protein product [Linum trigynum]|uniref:F-box domain-containing protein n=1 Tax=Linum trigynum TaxID=586398 RepID=A0AAV2CAI9_9ROSI
MAEERELKNPKTIHNDHHVKKLDDLPDHVFLHILSFLDTKSLIRTSALRKGWRTLWKDTLTLNFHCSDLPGYIQHADNLLLSLRRRAAALPTTVRFYFKATNSLAVLSLVMRHYDVVLPGPQLQDLSVYAQVDGADFFIIAGHAIGDLLKKSSLETLRLSRWIFRAPASPEFISLTRLELSACRFHGGGSGGDEQDATTTTATTGSATVHVCFANFPSLKCLKLLRCRWSGRVEVWAPQVLDLEIWNPSSCFEIGKLSAPKVESFTFSGYVPRRYLDDDDDDGEISYGLPSLDRASLRLVWEEPGRCDGRK